MPEVDHARILDYQLFNIFIGFKGLLLNRVFNSFDGYQETKHYPENHWPVNCKRLR